MFVSAAEQPNGILKCATMQGKSSDPAMRMQLRDYPVHARSLVLSSRGPHCPAFWPDILDGGRRHTPSLDDIAVVDQIIAICTV
jgi:hypothetical protein